MGVAGAAIGTLVSGIVNIALLILYLAKSSHEIKFSARKAFDIDMGFVKSYASKAFPNRVQRDPLWRGPDDNQRCHGTSE